MKYEEIVESDNHINYGIIKGSNTLLYIKVGNGGSVYGYSNKYLEIATKAHEKTGCTILVASNPLEVNEINNIESDMEFIKQYFNNTIDKIYAFGHSNGGVILLNYAYLFPKIKKVLSINAPLNINWHKIKEGITLSTAKSIQIVYGTFDPSYRYIELLKAINKDNLEVIEINGMDHNFSQDFELFCDLSFKYMFKEEV